MPAFLFKSSQCFWNCARDWFLLITQHFSFPFTFFYGASHFHMHMQVHWTHAALLSKHISKYINKTTIFCKSKDLFKEATVFRTLWLSALLTLESSQMSFKQKRNEDKKKRQTEIHYGKNMFYTVKKAIKTICISNKAHCLPWAETLCLYVHLYKSKHIFSHPKADRQIMHLERSLNTKADFQFPSSQYYKALTTTTKNHKPTTQQQTTTLEEGVFCKSFGKEKTKHEPHTTKQQGLANPPTLLRI